MEGLRNFGGEGAGLNPPNPTSVRHRIYSSFTHYAGVWRSGCTAPIILSIITQSQKWLALLRTPTAVHSRKWPRRQLNTTLGALQNRSGLQKREFLARLGNRRLSLSFPGQCHCGYRVLTALFASLPVIGSERTQTRFGLVVPRCMLQACSSRYRTNQPTSEIRHTNTEAEMIRSSCSGACFFFVCVVINVPRRISCIRFTRCTLSILRHGSL